MSPAERYAEFEVRDQRRRLRRDDEPTLKIPLDSEQVTKMFEESPTDEDEHLAGS